MTCRRYLWISLVITAGLTGLHIGMIRSYAGELAPAIDDTYIHLVFARSLAEGRLLEFVPGEGYVRGATSFLYPAFLALFLLAGAPQSAMLWIALVAGGVFYWLAAWGVFHWVRRLSDRTDWAFLAGLFFLTSGSLQWGIFSGMEIALFSALLAGSLALMPVPGQASGAQKVLFLLVASLLALVRPEGGLMTALMCLLLGLGTWRRSGFLAALPFAFPPLFALVKPILDFALTGSIIPSGLRAKAAFAGQMSGGRQFDWIEVLYNGLLGIRFRFGYFGAQYAEFFKGFVWLVVIIGVAKLCAVARRSGRGWEAAAALVPATFAMGLLCFLLPVGDWQYNRYFLHFLVVFVPLMAIGIHAIDQRLALRGWFSSFVLFLSVLMIPHWSIVLAKSAQEIRLHHVRLSEWMDQHLAPDDAIAVNDAGFTVWLGRCRIVDLIGLVSPRFESPVPMAIWDRIEAMPPEERPDYFVVYPHWFPQLIESGFLTGIHHIKLGGRLVSVGNGMTVLQPDWDWVGRGSLPIQADTGGYRLVDTLNVGLKEDERAHDYSSKPSLRGEEALEWTYTFRSGTTVVMDSGRHIRGSESFETAAQPGRDLMLVTRYEPGWHDHTPMVLDVEVDGQPAGVWRLTPWVTAGRDILGPDDKGRWLKGRFGHFYLATDELRDTSELRVEVMAGDVPSTVTQTVRIKDMQGRVLAEDTLTSGATKTLRAGVGNLPRAGRPGCALLQAECSYLHYPTPKSLPGVEPEPPRAVRLVSFALHTPDDPSTRTLRRDMRQSERGRPCEATFNISGELVRRTPLRIKLSTNMTWSDGHHNSFHYWAFAPEQNGSAPKSDGSDEGTGI